MESSRSLEIKVGVLILTALALLAGFVLVMGGVNFQPTYPLNVDFDNPGGLQTGAPVKIASVRVGKITGVEFRGGTGADGKREPLVRMTVRLEKRYQESVRENSMFYVTTQGVLGEQFLAIEPGSHEAAILKENAVVRGIDPPRLDLLLSEGYELLHTMVSTMREHRGEVYETFQGLKHTLKGTGKFFEENGDSLGRTTKNVEAISEEGLATLRSARAKFVDNPAIDRILEGADRVSTAAAADVPPLLADARSLMGSTRGILGSSEDQARLQRALMDLADAAGHAKTVAETADTLTTQIKSGKGTVGQMLMDEGLYDDIQEVARDLKHNPWKFFWKE